MWSSERKNALQKRCMCSRTEKASVVVCGDLQLTPAVCGTKNWQDDVVVTSQHLNKRVVKRCQSSVEKFGTGMVVVRLWGVCVGKGENVCDRDEVVYV